MNGIVAPPKRVLVLGATSQIGFFLIPKLAQCSIEVVALTRRNARAGVSSRPALDWRTYSPHALATSLADAGRIHTAVCLAPLPTLLPQVCDLSRVGVKRLIAFGTTGRFHKADSADRTERQYIQELIAAETELPDRCSALGIDWTLFRPTLVYGCGRDANITLIAWFVRRFGFFPLSQGGRGLRQPVHAADLAGACADVLENSTTYAKTYNLSGGTSVSYREMVHAVFRQLGKPILTPHVPIVLLRTAIAVAKRLPQLRGLSGEMATRMGSDMCFDHRDATSDFGFRPRSFTLDDLAVGGDGL